ncbi:hypothetical protein MLD38_037832 [Melastoma candidum]|uniref:Uncharacterized protein n=1 Tax=Melastoma candidum TaxID=119954 RepID=A0ACB9LP70_9MYRT|nr:hypothetical protein MLD38_037832 [Melastoma candidum]
MARRPKRGAPPSAPSPEEAAYCPALVDDSVRSFKELMAKFAYTGSSAKPREKVVSPYFQKGNAGDTLTPLAPRKTILSPCLKKTAKQGEERENLQVVEMDAAQQDSVLLKVASAQSERSKPPRRRDSRGRKIRVSPYFAKREADEVTAIRREKVVSPYFQKGNASDIQTVLARHKTILSSYLRKTTKWGEEREKLQVEEMDVAQQDSVLLKVASAQSERNKPPRRRDSKGRKIGFHLTLQKTRQILNGFFERYPDAKSAAVAYEIEMEGMIRGLGLQKNRTRMIKRLSAEYLDEDWQYVTELHGVGKCGRCLCNIL